MARLVNDLNLSVQSAHFWGMDEWYLNGAEAPVEMIREPCAPPNSRYPLPFSKAGGSTDAIRLPPTRAIDQRPMGRPP